jgi:uncharacterized protein YbbC (DUF1343 family)
MRTMCLPGIGFRRVNFVPTFHKHKGVQCNGVQVYVLDREAADPFVAGLMLCDTIRAMYPQHFSWLSGTKEGSFSVDRLLGTDDYRMGRLTAKELIAAHRPGIDAFSASKSRYHLY